ncbi:MAG: aminoacyl-tRNA hydrolase, partial [Blastocatellia bacterium]|nr:aminoacyl-tRNA hydrolase [Blastocatellia bacterium]
METVPSTKWLVAGLGNPGPQYEHTRHNIGFMVIDQLAQEFEALVARTECRSLIGHTALGGDTIELAKPQTYMNLSGEALSCLLAKPDRSIEKLIVISDDAALPLARVRIRPKGSHGGHNGLRSIIERLGTQEFIR